METSCIYPNNTVVTDCLKTYEVFEFLFKILKSQTNNLERFTPIPVWFTKNKVLDVDLFKSVVNKISPASMRNKPYTVDDEIIDDIGEDAYYLLRFMVLSCPLKLQHVKFKSWDQFKVTWPDDVEQKFEKLNTKLDYLYHGSPLSNWQSILRNGIKVTSGTNWMTTGAAYGNGIYLSDTLNISYHYCKSRSVGIVIGIYEIYNADQYLKTANIYVVPKEECLLLRYLIFAPTSSKILELDASLRLEWDKKSDNKIFALLVKQKKLDARISKEIALLIANKCVVTKNSNMDITVSLHDNKYKITFPFMFPFSAPTISGVAVENWTVKSNLVDFILPLHCTKLDTHNTK